MQLLTNSIIKDKQKLTTTATIPIIVNLRKKNNSFLLNHRHMERKSMSSYHNETFSITKKINDTLLSNRMLFLKNFHIIFKIFILTEKLNNNKDLNDIIRLTSDIYFSKKIV
jgi:hypothetical protein